MDDTRIEMRLELGHAAGMLAKTLEHKPYGQTSKDVYPYTYWWVKGYNDAIDERVAAN